MYRILPSVRVGWQDVWHGAVVTGMLFTVGKFAIGMYLGKAGVQSGFGAAGSIVVLLVWVFYSSQIFLLGAEFTWLYAHNQGTRAGDAASRFLRLGHAPTWLHSQPLSRLRRQGMLRPVWETSPRRGWYGSASARSDRS